MRPIPGVATTLLLLLACASLTAVDGVNLPGSDYTNFTADSWPVCRNTCGGDSRCQAWTWVKPGIQGPTGRCWLKHRLPTIVKDNCCNSGSREFIEKQHLTAENRTDRPGLDYTNFATGSWKECQAACGKEDRCTAWTHVRPGVQGPQGRCWLKQQKVPIPVSGPNTISGVKFKPRAVRID